MIALLIVAVLACVVATYRRQAALDRRAEVVWEPLPPLTDFSWDARRYQLSREASIALFVNDPKSAVIISSVL